MNRAILATLFSISLVCAQQETTTAPAATPLPEGAPAALASIERTTLREHAMYLASDELGGRYTGSEGQQLAAEYIAAHFEKHGLRPLGDKGHRSYFQDYPVERTWLDPKGTAITVGDERFADGFAIIPGADSKPTRLRGGLVFCGLGSPREIPGGLKTRVPVVVLRTTRAAERSGMASVRSMQKARSIAKEVERRGGRAVVFCVLDDDSGIGDSLNYGGLLPGKPLLRFGSNRGRRSNPLADGPAVFVSRKLSLAILAALGVEVRDDFSYTEADPKARAKGKLEVRVRDDAKSSASNVVAWLEGTSKAKEAVVFSAHMDHMGTRMDGDTFNGADDNASGTSALLEIAEAFASTDPPRRSIVFLSVSGEELGLWGSRHFSDHPTWPVARIVADVNIDMIGRSTSLSGAAAISVTPSHEHEQFSTLVQQAARCAEQLGLALTNGDRFYQRSDHYNFARKGIPVVFFCDGEHEDYHRVTDEPDKLDYAKMETVARLAFWTGWETAQADGRPERLGRQEGWGN